MTAALAFDHIVPTYRRWPVEIVSGRGATVTDASGRSYLDLVAGIAVAGVGHCHPRVIEAIALQAADLIHVSNLYVTRPQIELAERLGGLTGGMESFFCNSGAESIECALKLARKRGRTASPDKTRIIAAEEGFHGRTYGALSATGQPKKKEPFRPVLPGFTHVPYGDAAALEAAMDADVAAVLLEPIQGEAGVRIPPEGYLEAARAACDGYDALLVLDEVQTGLGRTGAWFGHQHSAATPDVMCLAKALASGLPMGACLIAPAASVFEPGDHATTFGGGPVQSAAALATLEVIEEEGLVDRSRIAGERFLAGLAEVFADREIRGRGLLIGIEVGDGKARAVAEAALHRAVLVNDATPDVVRLCPPLVISNDQVDRAVEVLAGSWDEVRSA